MNQPQNKNKDLSGDLIIFHAGSLSVPFQKIAKAFEQAYPGTHILLEAAGSVDCARKITDLHKPCDIMASSDYKVITKFLIPKYTSWYLPFAGNEMVIAFTEKSSFAKNISKENWIETLLNPEVRYGRSEPDADPCGYRTEMLWQLAASYYHQNDLVEKLALKDIKYIRPKEVDLLSMLELRETDYIFIYRSVAIQHGLKYLELPDEINLSNIDMDEHYRQAVVSIQGKTPGNPLEVSGEAIIYAITMLDNAPNPPVAKAFLGFLLDEDKGMKILTQAGHNSLIPVHENPEIHLPDYLTKYTTEKI
jgi:molybdate/tungstate transport system substrate-binding protein